MALPDRWTPLRPLPVQLAYVNSPHRFNVVPAGRRSGKTERAKRKVSRRAIDTSWTIHPGPPRLFCAAPTRQQAKQIYWDDMKLLTRPWWAGTPLESELSIKLINGSTIMVFGMDKPQRFEGQPWDGGIMDEFGNMKAEAWTKHVRPALSDRRGWCDLIGVPEGRNHYYTTYTTAMAEMQSKGAKSEWGAYTWFSAEVLDPSEIASAKADLDPLSFAQEYEASFVNFEGRAYYAFTDANKMALRQYYNPVAPLILCFDFNVAPGVAVVCQTMRVNGEVVTAVIGEVWIPDNSNTTMVCRRLLRDWQGHTGFIEVYGDATGGSRGTSQVVGSDWDIVKSFLRQGDPSTDLPGFGDRVTFRVPLANPAERARVNAVNARTCTTTGVRRLLVDPSVALHVAMDLEGVRTVKGGSGEIDKKVNPTLTHISDALGYYLVSQFPILPGQVSFSTLSP